MCMGSKGKEHAKNMKEYRAPRRFEPPITTWAVALLEFEPRTSRAPYPAQSPQAFESQGNDHPHLCAAVDRRKGDAGNERCALHDPSAKFV